MLRVLSLTTSLRALSVSRASAGSRLAAAAARPGLGFSQLHTSSSRKDMATGAEPVGLSEQLTPTPKKTRAPRTKKTAAAAGTEGDAKPKKAAATKASKAAKAPKVPKAPKAPKPVKVKAVRVAKPKVPAKPKRVLHPPKLIRSPYIMWYHEEVSKIPRAERKKGPEMTQSLIQKYRDLNAEEKAALEQRLKDHQAQHAKDLEAWKASITPEQIAAENKYRLAQRKTGKKGFKRYTDDSKPKKPLPAFFRYCARVRGDPELSSQILGVENAQEIPAVEQSKALSTGWKALSDAERAEINDEYLKDKAEHEQALEQWKAQKASPSTA